MAEEARATLVWEAGLRFAAHSGSGHTVTMDSPGRPGHAGPSPIEQLLIALAGCTGMDVVAILEKMREPIAGLEIEVRGERRDQNPKHLTAVALTYRVRGAVSREKVGRAVELSHTTYCAVLASLRPDCKVATTIEVVEG